MLEQTLSGKLYKLLFEYQHLESDLMHMEAPGKQYLQRLNRDLESLLIRDHGVLGLLSSLETQSAPVFSEVPQINLTDVSDSNKQTDLPLC